jgi:Flp pilus assembly protein TadD
MASRRNTRQIKESAGNPPDDTRHARKKTLLLVAAILLLTAVTFSSSLSNNFLNMDDNGNITMNEHIRALSWQNIKTLLSTPVLGMYGPLVYLLYTINYQIDGLNPPIYHLTNLALHLLNVALVFFVIFVMTRNTTTAAIVCALFAVHPLNAAAVTPVSVTSSLLYSLFYLAAYLTYIKYIERPRGSIFLLALVFFILSALSKSAAVVFPLLLILTDYHYKRSFSRRIVFEKIPFLLISCLFSVLLIAFRTDTAALGNVQAFSFLDRILLSTYAASFYLSRLVVPIGLSGLYPYPEKVSGHLPYAFYLAPFLLLLVVWLATKFKKQRGAFVFGALFFLIHIFLVLRVLPIGTELVADRYAYLPSIGVFFIAGEMISPLKRRGRAIASAAVIACVLAFAAVSFGRNAIWKDNMAFYNSIIRQYPNAAVAYVNRGAARLTEANDVSGALADFDKAIKIDPAYAAAYYNSAIAMMHLKNYRGALAGANKAIELSPRESGYYQVRANARLALGDYQGTISDEGRSIELNPRGPETYIAWANSGVARMYLNDGAGAIADFSKAIELNPAMAGLYLNRALARAAINDSNGALEDYARALELDPALAAAYYHRGVLRERLGNRTGSCEDAQRALKIGAGIARELAARVCGK